MNDSSYHDLLVENRRLEDKLDKAQEQIDSYSDNDVLYKLDGIWAMVQLQMDLMNYLFRSSCTNAGANLYYAEARNRYLKLAVEAEEELIKRKDESSHD